MKVIAILLALLGISAIPGVLGLLSTQNGLESHFVDRFIAMLYAASAWVAAAAVWRRRWWAPAAYATWACTAIAVVISTRWRNLATANKAVILKYTLLALLVLVPGFVFVRRDPMVRDAKANRTR